MNKKLVIFLIVSLSILFLVVTVSYLKKKKVEAAFSPAIFPGNYAVTVNLQNPAPEDKNFAVFNVVIFDNKPDSKFTDKTNFQQIYLKDNNDNLLNVEIYGEILAAKKPIKYKQDVYTVTIPVKFPLTSNFKFKNADIVFELINEEKIKFNFGDFSFIEYGDKNVESKYIELQQSYPIIKLEKDFPKIVGFIFEFNAKQDIYLEKFDFSLPQYGINKDKIKVLKGDANSTIELVKEDEFFNKYADMKEPGIIKNSDYSMGHLKLEKGINTVIIPFTAASKSCNPIFSLGGLLTLSSEGKEDQYLIPSFPYLKLNNYKMKATEELIFNNER